jgi:hypothetical protein
MALPMTDDARVKKFTACWDLWSAGTFDAYGDCYALDAKSEYPGANAPAADSRAKIVEEAKAARVQVPDQKGQLQLVLASGETVVGVVLVTGTVGGKATGGYAGIVAEYNSKGEVVHEQVFLDLDTFNGQVAGTPGVRPVVAQATPREAFVAKNDDVEKTNLEAVRKLDDAFGKHDAAAFGSQLDDHVVWSDQTLATDDDKAALLASTQKMWTAIGDARLDPVRTWAAGNYVAVQETLDGTAKGKAFSVPALAIYRLSAGRIAQSWLFYQHGALHPAK